MKSHKDFNVTYTYKKLPTDENIPWLENAELFDEMVELLEQSPQYNDPFTRIRINKAEEKIEFGCSLMEITASFPEVARLIIGNKPLTDENLSIFGMGAMIANIALNEEEKKLLAEANDAFKNFKPTAPVNHNKRNSNLTPEEFIRELLHDHPGMIIGESHNDISPKKILMDNMEMLKELGVKRILLEHLMQDTQGEMLAHYFAKPEHKMPRMLEDYLKALDHGQMCRTGYGFYDLVVSAKSAGIPVIPFDTRVSYARPSSIDPLQDKLPRYCMMNYLAKQQIDSGEKYVMLCGSAHVNYMSKNIPGVAQLAGVPCVVVEDIRPYEPKLRAAENHEARPDILALSDPEDPKGQLSILRASASISANQGMFKSTTLSKDAEILMKTMGGAMTRFDGKEGLYLRFKDKAQYQKFISDEGVKGLIDNKELRIAAHPQTVKIERYDGLNQWAQKVSEMAQKPKM